MAHAVFVGVPAHGHVNPTLGIVTELVRRGVRVTYHCGTPYRAAIEAAGATFHAYAADWIDVDMPHDGDVLGLARVIRAAEAKIAPALLPALATERPDVIVHDSLASWGKTLASALRVPAVSSLTTFVFDRRVALARPLLFARFVARHARDRVRLGEMTGLLETITNRERINIVYTSRAFQPFGDRLDASFVFVGPMPRDEPPLDAQLVALQRPIYVSLGTLFNDRAGLFRTLATGLAG
ncbi:MAG TPA: oleandomycin glycosyltransferase, partial [Candidatus Limnocylindria bacterium]|nr:oleandomycin glycosyltransferase [Candidatus Limnocylindria bacterium]